MLNKAPLQFTHFSVWLLAATRATIKGRFQPKPFNIQMHLVGSMLSLMRWGCCASESSCRHQCTPAVPALTLLRSELCCPDEAIKPTHRPQWGLYSVWKKKKIKIYQTHLVQNIVSPQPLQGLTSLTTRTLLSSLLVQDYHLLHSMPLNRMNSVPVKEKYMYFVLNLSRGKW